MKNAGLLILSILVLVLSFSLGRASSEDKRLPDVVNYGLKKYENSLKRAIDDASEKNWDNASRARVRDFLVDYYVMTGQVDIQVRIDR